MTHRYQCASCGKRFDIGKDDFCPSCGTAVPPSVLTRRERKETAVRLRAEGKLNYDDHCHEDDAWHDSYGASTHRAAVRSHEAQLRANYSAHQPADNPTRLSNANPAANQSADNPTRLSNANPAANQSADNPTRLSNANPAARPAVRNTSSRKKNTELPIGFWILAAIAALIFFRVLATIFGSGLAGNFFDSFAFLF